MFGSHSFPQCSALFSSSFSELFSIILALLPTSRRCWMWNWNENKKIRTQTINYIVFCTENSLASWLRYNGNAQQLQSFACATEEFLSHSIFTGHRAHSQSDLNTPSTLSETRYSRHSLPCLGEQLRIRDLQKGIIESKCFCHSVIRLLVWCCCRCCSIFSVTISSHGIQRQEEMNGKKSKIIFAFTFYYSDRVDDEPNGCVVSDGERKSIINLFCVRDSIRKSFHILEIHSGARVSVGIFGFSFRWSHKRTINV